MMDNTFEKLQTAASVLHLDFTSGGFAEFAENHAFSEEAMNAVAEFLTDLSRKKQDSAVQTLLKLSRLPVKAPKTFENFDFSLLKGRDVDKVRMLSSLLPLYSHQNLAFIGPPGTGKTHLAQAFGYLCCQNGMKTYFIKASELRDRFVNALKAGKTASCVNGLVRPSCLIIDEIGHCSFDKESTRLFFDMIDRRYNKEGNVTTIFTSNKTPSLWKEDFHEDTTLLLALDRIFDDAVVYKIRGESYRGRKLQTVSIQTEKVRTTEADTESVVT